MLKIEASELNSPSSPLIRKVNLYLSLEITVNFDP